MAVKFFKSLKIKMFNTAQNSVDKPAANHYILHLCLSRGIRP
jgi:hypothetical protein